MRYSESQKAQATADVARELLKSMAAGSMTSATIKTFSSGDKRSPVDYRRHLARLRKANRRPLPDGAISAKALWYEAI